MLHLHSGFYCQMAYLSALEAALRYYVTHCDLTQSFVLTHKKKKRDMNNIKQLKL